jgi:hypothetical protein
VAEAEAIGADGAALTITLQEPEELVQPPIVIVTE